MNIRQKETLTHLINVHLVIIYDCLDIILIEIIMAHEIALHGGKLISEIITDIHIHIYLGKELTFTNTVIM
jgi:hypothetical protein